MSAHLLGFEILADITALLTIAYCFADISRS